MSCDKDASLLSVYHAALAKLAECRCLGAGWDGYGTDPPSADACRMAEFVLSQLYCRGFLPEHPRPSAAGGIGITLKIRNRSVYIECCNHGTIHTHMSNGYDEYVHVAATVDDCTLVPCLVGVFMGGGIWDGKETA